VKGLFWEEQPLTEHAVAVKAAIADLTGRVAQLQERREKAGRVFSATNYEALDAIATEGEALMKQLRDVLKRAEPQKQIDKTELRRLWLDYQRTIAHLNGVPRS
jgi:hypothetical protein